MSKYFLICIALTANMNFDDISPCQYILDNRSVYIDSLYNSCLEKIKKMVVNNHGSQDDAYDVFQEAFTVLFLKCKDENFKLTCDPCTYLYKVSYNLWLKQLNKRGKMMKNKPKHIDENNDDIINDSMQRESIIAKYFILLGERCRQILQLDCIEGLSGKEVAEKLGLSYGYYRVAKKRCLDDFFKDLVNDPKWNDLKS